MRGIFWGVLAGLLTIVATLEVVAATVQLSYASSVPQNQQQLLETDLQLLPHLPFVDPPFPLQEWLSERARYVIDENFVVSSKNLYAQQTGGRILMSNVGVAMYTLARKYRMPLKFQVPGVGVIPVRSPRVGVLRIGEGMFETLSTEMPSSAIFDRLHSIFRLSTLFHEARHSDGHAKSLGFAHVLCPKGHDYEGQYACDMPTNGAYAIQARFLKSVREACQDCRVQDKEILSVLQLDSQSRILGNEEWADEPESF